MNTLGTTISRRAWILKSPENRRRRLGVKLTVVDMDFDGLVPALNGGKGDFYRGWLHDYGRASAER